MRPHNTYSKTTTTTIKISLRTTGEAMKPRNRFLVDWLSLAFRPDLDPLLVLDTELPLACRFSLGFPYFHNRRNDDRTTMNLFIKESAQGILYFGINEAWLTRASFRNEVILSIL
jgi:hypothetical protein